MYETRQTITGYINNEKKAKTSRRSWLFLIISNYFFSTSRCLETSSNTLKGILYIFLIGTKNNE